MQEFDTTVNRAYFNNLKILAGKSSHKTTMMNIWIVPIAHLDGANFFTMVHSPMNLFERGMEKTIILQWAQLLALDWAHTMCFIEKGKWCPLYPTHQPSNVDDIWWHTQGSIGMSNEMSVWDIV